MGIKEDITNHALTLINAKNQVSDIVTSPSTPAEIQAEAIFDDNFGQILELHNWRFATTRATVSALIDVTGITAADPGVVTAAAHGLADGTKVRFSDLSEMTEINLCSDPEYFLVDDATTNTFEIQDEDAVDYDTSGYDAETTGGYVFAIPEHEFTYRANKPSGCLHIIREINGYDFREEGAYLVSDESELEIEYIDDWTLTTAAGSAFKKVLALAMARDLAIPIIGSRSLSETMEGRYMRALRAAKTRNANKGTEYARKECSWNTARW
jgi:hypothetical protein